MFHAEISIYIQLQKKNTSGGRVLAVTALGETIEIARKKAYENVKKITFEDVNFRNDIGMDLIALNN